MRRVIDRILSILGPRAVRHSLPALRPFGILYGTHTISPVQKTRRCCAAAWHGALAIAALIALALPAVAEAPVQPCTDAPESQWQSAEAARKKLAEHGLEVRQLRTVARCYVAEVADSSGQRLVLHLNPVTLSIVGRLGK